MSAISTVFDAYVTVVSGELTTYVKIPNAYEINTNSSLFYQKGFAVAMAGGTNSNRQLACQLSVVRDFSVIIVNQLTAAVTDFTGFNQIANNLFEDQYKIIKAIEKHPTLTTSVSTTKFLNDGGLEFMEAGKAKYFLIESVFQTEYFEDLNT